MADTRQRHNKLKKCLKNDRSQKWWLHLIAVPFVWLISLIISRHISNFQSELIKSVPMSEQCREAPKYWGVCLWNWNSFGNLRTMDRVFERLEYVAVNASKGEDWDVLWSIEYPFNLTRSKLFSPVFKPLKPHQKINHFPGINFITDKSFMSTRNRDIKNILPGFRFPAMIKEFKEYIKTNPSARFVEKSFENRGVKLVNRKDIVFDTSKKFYQLFMERPLLIDGRFMDFSVYVLISSINPLRIYRFENDVYIRFCPKPYYPFDPTDLDKYVISDTREIFIQHPTMKEYYNTYGYSFKLSLESYFRKKGLNVTELWRKIDKTIVQLVLNNERNIMDKTSQLYNSSHHFFEFLRIDFLLNEDLEPHLTEVNMSPGMTPNSEIFQHLAQDFEQPIYNTLRLVGAGSKMELMSRYDNMSSQMFSNSKNIAVNTRICVSNDCDKNCGKPECELCTPCLGSEDIDNMHRAYREHVRRGGFKRIFPTENHFGEDFVSKMTPRNQILIKWFKAKCAQEEEWC